MKSGFNILQKKGFNDFDNMPTLFVLKIHLSISFRLKAEVLGSNFKIKTQETVFFLPIVMKLKMKRYPTATIQFYSKKCILLYFIGSLFWNKVCASSCYHLFLPLDLEVRKRLMTRCVLREHVVSESIMSSLKLKCSR